jgi:hypothetical protein
MQQGQGTDAVSMCQAQCKPGCRLNECSGPPEVHRVVGPLAQPWARKDHIPNAALSGCHWLSSSSSCCQLSQLPLIVVHCLQLMTTRILTSCHCGHHTACVLCVPCWRTVLATAARQYCLSGPVAYCRSVIQSFKLSFLAGNSWPSGWLTNSLLLNTDLQCLSAPEGVHPLPGNLVSAVSHVSGAMLHRFMLSWQQLSRRSTTRARLCALPTIWLNFRAHCQ